MGRTRGSFLMPQTPAGAVLQAAANFGMAEKMTLAQPLPNQLVLSKGSSHLGGRRVIVVAAWDTPTGAQVAIEGWTEIDLWGEINADPKTFVAMVPRRNMWKMLSALAAMLGAPGATAAFQHF